MVYIDTSTAEMVKRYTRQEPFVEIPTRSPAPTLLQISVYGLP